jgi:outer membrane receptor protein involved in Fe transport
MKSIKMRLCNFFTIAVFGLASSSALLAQRPTGGERYRPEIASVSGVVVEADGTSPIPFASVALLAIRDSSIVAGQLANEEGQFSLTELPLGKYTLNVQFMGYEGFKSETITLTPKTSIAHDAGYIALDKKVNDLEEAVVATDASTLEMLIDRRVFRVGNDLSAAGGNASEILVNVPSVAVDIDGNVSLRGSSQVQILIDGRPSGLAGAAQNAFLEQIPASSIDRVEIITNPSAKYDPDGMAGILNIILKKNKLQGFHGQLQGTAGTGDNHNGSVSLNYKNDKFSVFSSASWNQRDLFREGESSRTLTVDSVSLLDQTRDGDQLRTSVNGRIGMEWYPSKSEVFSANINVNQSDNKRNNGLTNEEVWSTGTEFNSLRSSEELDASKGFDADLGYRKEYNQNPSHFLRLRVRYSGSASSSDEFIENNYFSVYPSFNVSRQRNDEVSWIASYSRRVNRPRGRSVTPFLDDSDSRNLRIGNPELRPEYTNSFEIGHQWSRKRKSLTTSFFVKETNDLIQRYSNIDAAGIRTSSWWNQGSRRDEGIEMILMLPMPGSGQFRLTGSFYHLANQVGDVEFASDAQGWSYNLNFFANQSIGDEKLWKWQLNGMYRGPSVTPQGQFNGFAYMDANIQRKLLDGNLTIAIKLSDVFNTREWSYTSSFGNLYQENRFKRESQNVFVTATWKLGKLEERGRKGGNSRGVGYGSDSGGMDF